MLGEVGLERSARETLVRDQQGAGHHVERRGEFGWQLLRVCLEADVWREIGYRAWTNLFLWPGGPPVNWLGITVLAAVSTVVLFAVVIRLLRVRRDAHLGDEDAGPVVHEGEGFDLGSLSAFARPGQCPECGRSFAAHATDCPNA